MSTGSPRIRLKAVLTIVILAIVFFLLVARQKNWDLVQDARSLYKPAPPQTPEDGIYKMLDAARAGNVNAYVDCFLGDMRQQVLQIVKETSTTQFSKYLISQNAAFTGVAVSITQRPDPQTAQVRVEYVYSQRNEVQNVSLRNVDGEWKIFKVAGSDQIKTLIPYGPRVTD
jgi:hypothetical protein